ncbi:Lon family ATP-dependent protease [uncultured Selenomonas sp.]|uniref:Lon family ATP-dependent protease n=1 Tax=uncultured Selenomonas sp. TaxID=159275 RepID=UPI0025D02479|nr:Lon family ATP-dependent protease [uncultured Selenomonas sp.]MDD6127747.1 Lon family ATP-dependent protease [Veillonellaceae bacterium]MDD6698773.1 Lon family ATP-dependent protease [Veillonellaceae bacterium]
MGLLDSILNILHQEKTTTRGEGHPSSFAASQQKKQAPQLPDDGDDDAPTEEELIAQELDREIQAFYAVLVDTMGSDKLVLQAGKLDALALMRSSRRGDRVLALERIVLENPTLGPAPTDEEIPETLADLSEHVADMMARKNVEDSIEKKVNDKLEQEHQDYVKDIRMQVLKEEKGPTESPQDAEKREKLEKMDKIHLTQSVMELLRPQDFSEIVGQERAVKSLMAKLASPYPQHLLLYGPPGVGKTTAARLVLEAAKKKPLSPFGEEAPFIETDGTTLRWDPRDITNPLLGSVHDPIYQGAQKTLADNGVPEPKPGLVTDAHGGILFIDEIGEMDEMLQNKLLKVLEDKRAYFDSAYYDPTDPKVPPYIRKLFEEGAPADFVLIGATTRDAGHINPALRSRCAEIYFEPLTPAHIVKILHNAAAKLHVQLADGVADLISEYTIEGRKAINILADAYSLALERSGQDKAVAKAIGAAEAAGKSRQEAAAEAFASASLTVEKEDIYEVAQVSRLYQFVTKKAKPTAEQGHIFGLGVAGFLGSVIEIEAVAFPAHTRGKGTVRFNETAGSMAKDSVFNAASVLRKVTGKDIHDYDVHINVIGGGNIDGPSAGTAILSAIVSAVTGRKIRQDVAVTGEISLAGRVRPVGGVFEKAYGAKQAGIRLMVIPEENKKDIPDGLLGLDIRPVKTAEEAFEYIFAPKSPDDTPVEIPPEPEKGQHRETLEERQTSASLSEGGGPRSGGGCVEGRP